MQIAFVKNQKKLLKIEDSISAMSKLQNLNSNLHSTTSKVQSSISRKILSRFNFKNSEVKFNKSKPKNYCLGLSWNRWNLI